MQWLHRNEYKMRYGRIIKETKTTIEIDKDNNVYREIHDTIFQDGTTEQDVWECDLPIVGLWAKLKEGFFFVEDYDEVTGLYKAVHEGKEESFRIEEVERVVQNVQKNVIVE